MRMGKERNRVVVRVNTQGKAFKHSPDLVHRHLEQSRVRVVRVPGRPVVLVQPHFSVREHPRVTGAARDEPECDFAFLTHYVTHAGDKAVLVHGHAELSKGFRRA